MTARLVQNTISEYHQKDGYLSKSVLADILDCPAKFKHWHIEGNKKPESKALIEGNALHTLSLEPDLFKSRFYVMPECDRRTKEGKEIWAAAQEEAKGKTLLDAETHSRVIGMATALAQSGKATSLFKMKGKIEQSIYWEDETGKWKCRPDQMCDNGVIIDLKKTKNAHPRLFASDAVKYHYDISVALTSRGYKALTGKLPENYVLVTVEDHEPYIVEVYDTYRPFSDLDVSFYEFGESRLERAIHLLKECRSKNHWPSYSETIQPLSVPAWGYKAE